MFAPGSRLALEEALVGAPLLGTALAAALLFLRFGLRDWLPSERSTNLVHSAASARSTASGAATAPGRFASDDTVVDAHAEQECPRCARWIDLEATTCPHCRARVRTRPA
jgi:hypothetical protein